MDQAHLARGLSANALGKTLRFGGMGPPLDRLADGGLAQGRGDPWQLQWRLTDAGRAHADEVLAGDG